jgi:hypothetical protein
VTISNRNIERKKTEESPGWLFVGVFSHRRQHISVQQRLENLNDTFLYLDYVPQIDLDTDFLMDMWLALSYLLMLIRPTLELLLQPELQQLQLLVI